MPTVGQVASLTPALIGAGSALFVSLVVAWIGYRHYLRERAHDQETLLNALFGELATLYEHYSFAAHELPLADSDTRQLRVRLQWSMYGDLKSTQEISRYGFLSAGDIRLLLQLGLRVRNNDRFLELLLAELSAIRPNDLSSAKRRMEYALSTTLELIHRLTSKHPRLRKILLAIENDLPSIQKKG